MKFKTRRLIGNFVRLCGRSFEDVAQELQEWLEKLSQQVEGGIPGGFNKLDPEPIEVGAAADPGSEAAGWAAADHIHPSSSGTPSDITLGAVASQGSSSAISRSDHVHGTQTLLAELEADEYLSWVM